MKLRIIDGVEVHSSFGTVYADLGLADAEQLKIKTVLVFNLNNGPELAFKIEFHLKAASKVLVKRLNESALTLDHLLWLRIKMKIIKVGITPQEKIRERMLAIAKGEFKPKPSDPRIWFTSMRSLSQVLSDKNRTLSDVIRKPRM